MDCKHARFPASGTDSMVDTRIDDDCVADKGWLKHLAAPFMRDPNIGAVGGEVAYLQSNRGIVDRFYQENMPPGRIT